MKKPKAEDEYYLAKTIESSNAIVRVYAPILTDEENERRMKRLYDATEELLKEQIRNKNNLMLPSITRQSSYPPPTLNF